MKFKNDRILLLRMLREIVKKQIEAGSLNTFIEEDVSNYLMDVTDKRQVRKLKKIMNEVDKWLKDMVKISKLEREETLYNQAKMKECPNYEEIFNNP